MTYYMPRRNGDLLNWANNFKIKLPTVGPQIGLSTGDVTNGVAYANDIIAKVQGAETKEAEKKAANEARELSKKVSGGGLQAIINRAKKQANYTEAYGKELGIVGEANDSDLADFKSKITGTTAPGHVVIKFTKKGVEGVNIYARFQGEQEWQFLGRDTYSPYHDTRALKTPGVTETREYCAYGLIDDEEIGLQSDIISVVFSG